MRITQARVDVDSRDFTGSPSRPCTVTGTKASLPLDGTELFPKRPEELLPRHQTVPSSIWAHM